MAKNLLNLLQGQLSEGVIGKIANLIGTNASNAKSAIDNILPGIVKSISDKGSTSEGAKSLLELKSDKGLGSKTLNNLDNLLSDNDGAKSLKKSGKKLTGMLLGDKEDSILGDLSKKSGLSKDQTSDLYKYLTPLALSNVDSDYFGGSTSSSSSSSQSTTKTTTSSGSAEILEGLTEDESAVMLWIIPLFLIGGYMLFFKWNPQPEVQVVDESKYEVVEHPVAERNAAAVAPAAKRTVKKNKNKKKIREGVRMARENNQAARQTNAAKKPTAATGAAAGAVATGAAAAANKATTATGRRLSIANNGNLVDQNGKVIAKNGDFKLDAKGNLVNNSGSMLAKAGTFTGKIPGGGTAAGAASNAKYKVDAKGNLVDANGKIIFAKGQFSQKDGYYVDSKGNKIGEFIKDVGNAIGGAAGKTADFFKDTFGGMFKKKEAAVGTKHTLSRITFDPKSHRITNFSKNEVEGLAAALKAYPDSKIQVQVHSAQSSKDRAQVVHDMLVTLGVADKQISFKGMGDGDAAKAKAGKVEIMVEK